MKIVLYTRVNGESKTAGTLDLPAVPRIGETLYIVDMKQTRLPAFKVTDVLYFAVPREIQRDAHEDLHFDQDLYQVVLVVERIEPAT